MTDFSDFNDLMMFKRMVVGSGGNRVNHIRTTQYSGTEEIKSSDDEVRKLLNLHCTAT